MKISFILPGDKFSHNIVDGFEKHGVEVVKNTCTNDCDFLIGISHSQLPTIKKMNDFYPHIPMVNYNWDFYGWVDMKSSAGYNWPGYGELLKKSLEIWTPSEEVNIRTEEFLGLGHKCKIIKSYARIFDEDIDKVVDGRYIYNPIRDLPLDPNFGWLDKVAKKHNLPVYKSLHRLSEEEFRKKILECTFLCCELLEASTGGLTLLEGFHYGKPVLICDSKYMGAKDYFGDKANYYKHDSFEDFERAVLDMWENTPKLDIKDCRKITNELTVENMVSKMYNRLLELKNDK